MGKEGVTHINIETEKHKFHYRKDVEKKRCRH